MTWPANSEIRLLQAERDLTRAERRTELAQARIADAKGDVARAQAALERERIRSAQLLAALDQVYASTSWRFSRPVRTLSRVIAALRRTPPPLPPVIPPDETASSPAAPALPRREAAILQRLHRKVE